MGKQKRVLRQPLQSEQEFAVFLKRVREESGVLGEELAEGLMDSSQLSRIENEKRPVLKSMRDCLLGRLGVTPDMYENLLNNEDYVEWEWQHKILRALEQKDFLEAERLIGEYEIQKSKDGKIKNQFCIMMRAELFRLQGATRSEITRLYGEAVQLTVPDVKQVYEKLKLLSVLEVNMVLEYEYYREPKYDFAARCKYWLDYVEDSLYDDLSKAKIYPKITYYYLREILMHDNGITLADLQQALERCSYAIGLLRNMGRAFYLVELLEYKGKILAGIINRLAESGERQDAVSYWKALEESVELERALKNLYAEYDVPVYMQDCTYLYRQRWVYAIGDVLRIRRKMLGLTQREVCDGICSVKSLQKAEQRKMNMQREPLGKVMRRLGLSKEIQKANIVTNDRRALELMTEMAFCRNNREVGKARMLLEKLRAKICLEIPENEQYIMETEASLDLMEGKITKDEFVLREERALQCTLKTTRLNVAEGVYLTEMEMACIRQRLKWIDIAEKRSQIDFLLGFFRNFEAENRLSDYMAMYEFVMERVTGELGNMGEHQLAIKMDQKVLQSILRSRRVYMVHSFLYDIFWNEKEQIEQPVEREKAVDILKRCVIFSRLCKKIFYENFYLDKMNQVK